jgi:hypothetical protein
MTVNDLQNRYLSCGRRIMIKHSGGRFRAGKWRIFERGVRPAELERTDVI